MPNMEAGNDGVRKTKGGPVMAEPRWAESLPAELEQLRAEARRLGVPINPNWPLVILREQVAAAKAR